MSVPEMRKLLGLKKTDSYWLVHKNFFKTEVIGGMMRIDLVSFEKWYANQVKYKKVDGEEPGKESDVTGKDTVSLEIKEYIFRQEAAELAGASVSTVTKWMQTGEFQCVGAGKVLRIHRQQFLNWLNEHREGVI